MKGTQDQLQAFAAHIADGKHSFQAALAVVGGDANVAVLVHEVWRNDPFVIREVKRLHNEGDNDNVGLSKVEFLERIIIMIDNSRDDKAKVSLMNLYAEIKGFTGKNPQVQLNSITNKVMIVQSKGSDKEWSQGLREQQMKLVRGEVA